MEKSGSPQTAFSPLTSTSTSSSLEPDGSCCQDLIDEFNPLVHQPRASLRSTSFAFNKKWSRSGLRKSLIIDTDQGFDNVHLRNLMVCLENVCEHFGIQGSIFEQSKALFLHQLQVTQVTHRHNHALCLCMACVAGVSHRLHVGVTVRKLAIFTQCSEAKVLKFYQMLRHQAQPSLSSTGSPTAPPPPSLIFSNLSQFDSARTYLMPLISRLDFSIIKTITQSQFMQLCSRILSFVDFEWILCGRRTDSVSVAVVLFVSSLLIPRKHRIARTKQELEKLSNFQSVSSDTVGKRVKEITSLLFDFSITHALPVQAVQNSGRSFRSDTDFDLDDVNFILNHFDLLQTDSAFQSPPAPVSFPLAFECSLKKRQLLAQSLDVAVHLQLHGAEMLQSSIQSSPVITPLIIHLHRLLSHGYLKQDILDNHVSLDFDATLHLHPSSFS